MNYGDIINVAYTIILYSYIGFREAHIGSDGTI
jgi:hypothetical protein